MSLNSVNMGKEVIIEKCQFQGETRRRLQNLGVLPGERVTPIMKNAGNLIVKVRESRLALNLDVASQIQVIS
ncbi:ferrous iron transport protein A [Oscillospiraceae bacterium OttesenSCG-928-G22]|nr:ferrous iron transport protein A [Oscillospiraceae bacterium OttesenSCG-928-G22]